MIMSLKVVVTQKYLDDLEEYLNDTLETKYGIPFKNWDEWDKHDAIEDFKRTVFDDARRYGYQKVADKYAVNQDELELLPEHFTLELSKD